MSIESKSNALKVASTLFYKKRAGNRAGLRLTYRMLAEQDPRAPYSTNESLVNDIFEVMDDFQDKTKHFDLLRLYWLKAEKYDTSEIFLSAIQFMDDHNAILPKTTLPPADDILEFSNFVLQSTDKATHKKQFEKLMQISGGNPIGASNVGFIASRLYARGGDTRAYPEIKIGIEDIVAWNVKMPYFEGNGKTNDASGDNYYFWTHFFAASTLRLIGTAEANFYDKIFEYGSDIMTFVRKTFVGQPTVTAHREASMIGRNLGIAVIEKCEGSI